MGNKNSPQKAYSDVLAMRQSAVEQLEKKAFSPSTIDEEYKVFYESQTSKAAYDQPDKDVNLVKIEEYKFPFENLIFEGGPNKGLAYVGCIRYLEEIGLLSQVKRVSGSSSGAMFAALVALGYNSRDLEAFLSDHIEQYFMDHSCGTLSLKKNILKGFGWNPGKIMHKWLGDKIRLKSWNKNQNMTFSDMYKEKKMELCVVVTNLNQMRAEYCHVKTTPDMPIRDALRMSMAFPVMFSAVKYSIHGQEDFYVDGGVACNFPVHCFDGWYLSMSANNSFLKKISPLKDLPCIAKKRFEELNGKSLGFLLYDETEIDTTRFDFERRYGALEPARPAQETKLYKKKLEAKKVTDIAEREHSRTVKAFEAFMNALKKYELLEFEFIDKSKLATALQDKDVFPGEYFTLLFGPNIDIDKAFKILDKDERGSIAFIELMRFIEAHGLRMQARFQSFGRLNISTFTQFLYALHSTILRDLKFLALKPHDYARTVGINTGYVGQTDSELEEPDREFLIQRGYNATRAYLRIYLSKHPRTAKKPLARDMLAVSEVDAINYGSQYNMTIAEIIHKEVLQKQNYE